LKIFPSYLSAALAGSIGFPLFILGLKYLQQYNFNDLLLITWSLIVFLIPLFFSTFDYRFFYNIYKREGSMFRSCMTNSDLEVFVYPSIKRILLYFVSGVFSVISMKIFGIFGF
jgi:hypothetical protein